MVAGKAITYSKAYTQTIDFTESAADYGMEVVPEPYITESFEMVDSGILIKKWCDLQRDKVCIKNQLI